MDIFNMFAKKEDPGAMSYLFPDEWKGLKVALSHDWLTGMRGGERVLELLCKGFPEAPVFSLIHNPGTVSAAIESHPIHTSALRHWPGVRTGYRYYLPLFPWAAQRMALPEVDLLISTSHCVAKGVRARRATKHLCYCFTPMRYSWVFYEEYFGKNPLKKMALKPLLAWLRRWDLKTSDRVDHFVAISEHVRSRIQTFYGRSADVVYPPVDTERYRPDDDTRREAFDLMVSALVPYKRVDLAVRAYTRMNSVLKVVGVGTELRALRRIAGPNIQFLEWQSDERVLDLYRRCRCLVFPGEEDFGMVPVEAMACGRPVVAYARGGALETVVDRQTGIFFHEQTEEALIAAVRTCSEHRWDPAAVRAHAKKFGIQAFGDGLAASIRACMVA